MWSLCGSAQREWKEGDNRDLICRYDCRSCSWSNVYEVYYFFLFFFYLFEWRNFDQRLNFTKQFAAMVGNHLQKTVLMLTTYQRCCLLLGRCEWYRVNEHFNNTIYVYGISVVMTSRTIVMLFGVFCFGEYTSFWLLKIYSKKVVYVLI